MTGHDQMLPAYNQALEQILEIFTAPEQTLDQRVNSLLKFCGAYFDLPLGVMGEIQGEEYVLRYSLDPDGSRKAGSRFQLDQTFCAIAISSGTPIAVPSIKDSEYHQFKACAAGELHCYIGAPIRVRGEIVGTVAFGGHEPRPTPFDPSDVTLVRLIANWMGSQFEAARHIDQLAQSERRFKRLYRKLPLIAFTHGRDMKITDVSDAWLKRMGYRRDEVIGKMSLEFVAHEDRRRIIENDHPDFWATGAASALPRRVRTKSGEIFEAELYAVALEGPEGSFDFGHVVMVDVTDRKLAQDAVAEKNAELEQVNEQLRHFAYIASHDLQEPLRKIRVFGGQLQDEIAQEITNDGQFALDTMVSAAERLSNLVTDVLTLSRTSYAGLTKQHVDLNELLDATLSELEESTKESGAKITIRDLPSIRGDREQLGRLFQNLVGNALKYRRPDTKPKIEISAKYEAKPSGCEITISDNGIGFEPEYQERIFQPFQRLHHKSKYSGSGIGLAVSKTIADKHGWQISAQGNPGQGAVFSIFLPGVEEKTGDQNLKGVA